MDLAYDLASHGANTSIVVGSPVSLLLLCAFKSTYEMDFLLNYLF
jgi:hypothetical protein